MPKLRFPTLFTSIRWRLVASYVLLTLLTVSVVGVLAVEIMRRSLQAQEINNLRGNAQSVALQVAPLIWPVVQPYELSQLIQTTAYLGDVRLRVFDSRQEVLIDSGEPDERNELVWIFPPPGSDAFQPQALLLPNGELLPLSEVELSLLQGLPPGTSLKIVRRASSAWGSRIWFESLTGENPTDSSGAASTELPRSDTVVNVPIARADGVLIGSVELSAAPAFGSQALEATQYAFLIAGAGAALLAAGIGMLISQRLTSPLSSLSEAAAQMGAGNLAVRAEVDAEDEIGELASQFNLMAGRLEASFEQLAAERDALRRFVADASHELRTPITALKNFISLLQGPAADDSAAQHEFLAESAVQVGRLEWITQNLLDLSRIDAGLMALELEQHPLAEILTSAAAPFQSIAAERGLALRLELPPADLLLRCDRARLELALTNLLDNACKFTPPGGWVALGAACADGHTQVWVADNGPGIAAEELAHIFERFYRGRSVTASGSGLGLAIVRSLVLAQGGQISVESAPGQGARFSLTWQN